jgi:hypothetical protein
VSQASPEEIAHESCQINSIHGFDAYRIWLDIDGFGGRVYDHWSSASVFALTGGVLPRNEDLGV